ncbi:glycosyltransferase family A protein [Helicobacter sp.]|uniref:glycosyltransferase family A protein n=1 Tax=Helicobacter sp. TaxID=218 RepID=UPI00389039AA
MLRACCGYIRQVCALDSPCKAPFLSQKSCREQVAPESRRNPALLKKLRLRLVFSSTILESQIEIRKQIDPTASDSAPENKQSPDSISTILESKKQDSSKSPSQANSLSSRDFRKEVVAIHSTSLDSSANAVDSMDCHALRSKARNDKNLDSNNNAQKCLESTFENTHAQYDSKRCGGALQALGQFGGGSYLSGNDRPQIAPILSNRSPKTESPQAKTPPVLVSLTSFPARLPYLHHTLYSLLTQDYKDFHIALFLSSSEVRPDELPLILKIFARLGLLSIHFVEENLRAYKKLFYALQAYPEHIIITIDDDQIYAPNTISLLLESYKKFPRAIHTNWTYDAAFLAEILDIDPAQYLPIIKENAPHLALASVGVSGVLYPPSPFSQEFFNTQAIVSLAPYNDDLWFFVMSVLNDVPKVLVKNALEHPKESSIAQDESPNLWEINCEQNRNYDQLRALLEAYPQARAKILKSLGLEPRI